MAFPHARALPATRPKTVSKDDKNVMKSWKMPKVLL